jgi:hypothetical protein
MGGAGAMDDIGKAVDTYLMLAEGTQKPAGATGKHWYQSKERRYEKKADEDGVQDKLLGELEKITALRLPTSDGGSKSAGL